MLATHEQTEGALAEHVPVAKATKIEFVEEFKDEAVGQKKIEKVSLVTPDLERMDFCVLLIRVQELCECLRMSL